MVVPDERLVLEASVVDEFTTTLGNLSNALLDIDRLAAETVEDITADVKIGKAMAELETLDDRIDQIEDRLTVGSSGRSGSNDIFDMDMDLTDGEAMSVANMFNPMSAFKHPSEYDGSDTSDAVGDGGGGPDPLGLHEITQAKEAMGEAFDPSEILGGSDVRRYADLFEDGLAEHLDGNEVMAAVMDDDTDLSLGDVQDAFSMGSTGRGGIGKLQRAGVLDIPDRPDTLLEQFKEIQLKMGDFFQIFASLVPLLAVFVASIPAVIGGLVGLGAAAVAAAGALAGVAGLAVLGAALNENGEIDTAQLTDKLSDFFDNALAEVAPVAQQLAPLFGETLTSIEGMLAGLADRSESIMGVTDDFRGMLDFIESTVPGALAKFVELGDAAMPLISGIIREIGNLGLLNSFAAMLNQTIGDLIFLGKAIFGLLGPIFQLSRGFLRASVVIFTFVSVLFQLLDLVPFLLPGLGMMASMLFVLVSVTALYTAVTSTAMAAVLNLVTAMAMKYLPTIASTVTSLHSLIAAKVGATIATITLTLAVATLIGILTFGLAPILGGTASLFSDLTGDVDEATESLEQFNRASGDAGVGSLGGGSSGFSSSGGYGSGGGTTVIAGDKQTGNAIANSMAFNGVSESSGGNVADRIDTQ